MKKHFSLFLLLAPFGLLAQSPPLSARFEVEPGCEGQGRIFVQMECTEDPFDVMEVWLTRHEVDERGERVLVDRMARRRVDTRTFVITNLARGGYYSVWVEGCDGKVVSVETYGGDGCGTPGVPFAPDVINSTTPVEAEKPTAPVPAVLMVDAKEVKKDVAHDGKPEDDAVKSEEDAEKAAADARRDDLVRDRSNSSKRDPGSNMHSSGGSKRSTPGSGGGTGGGTPQSGSQTSQKMSSKPR